jgi:hypothetical protein
VVAVAVTVLAVGGEIVLGSENVEDEGEIQGEVVEGLVHKAQLVVLEVKRSSDDHPDHELVQPEVDIEAVVTTFRFFALALR